MDVSKIIRRTGRVRSQSTQTAPDLPRAFLTDSGRPYEGPSTSSSKHELFSGTTAMLAVARTALYGCCSAAASWGRIMFPGLVCTLMPALPLLVDDHAMRRPTRYELRDRDTLRDRYELRGRYELRDEDAKSELPDTPQSRQHWDPGSGLDFNGE